MFEISKFVNEIIRNFLHKSLVESKFEFLNLLSWDLQTDQNIL